MRYFAFLILFFHFSCNITTTKEKDKHIMVSDNLNTELFINEINSRKIDTYELIQLYRDKPDLLTTKSMTFKDSVVSILYINGSKIDTLIYENAIYLTLYNETDLDGDGFAEIGVLAAYPNGSCRLYNVYSIKDNKWILFKSIRTHLPDRAKGVDYLKKFGNKVRLIEANSESCCQCEGLDTSYLNTKKVKLYEFIF